MIALIIACLLIEYGLPLLLAYALVMFIVGLIRG